MVVAKQVRVLVHEFYDLVGISKIAARQKICHKSPPHDDFQVLFEAFYWCGLALILSIMELTASLTGSFDRPCETIAPWHPYEPP